MATEFEFPLYYWHV